MTDIHPSILLLIGALLIALGLVVGLGIVPASPTGWPQTCQPMQPEDLNR